MFRMKRDYFDEPNEIIDFCSGDALYHFWG